MQTYYDNDNIIKKHPDGCVFVKMGKTRTFEESGSGCLTEQS